MDNSSKNHIIVKEWSLRVCTSVQRSLVYLHRRVVLVSHEGQIRSSPDGRGKGSRYSMWMIV